MSVVTIPSNEGAQSAALKEPITFTFQVPAGSWGGVMITITPGASSGSEMTAYARLGNATGAEADAVATLINPSYGPEYGAFFFGDNVDVGGPINSNPIHPFPPATGQTYFYYTELVSGGTIAVEMTPTDHAFNSVAGVMTLQSANLPPPPPSPPPPSSPPPSPPPITPVASYALAEDAHGRPVALSSNYATLSNGKMGASNSLATSINSLVSNDAGRTYLVNGLSDTAIGGGADNFGADNPCLLIDRRTNHFRAIYSLSQAYTYGGAPHARPPKEIALATGLLDDRLNASVAVIPNISGGLCVAAQHPTDADYALLVYSDISSFLYYSEGGAVGAAGSHDLKAAFSMDAGATWTALSTVLPALDLTATGRPALCFLGNTAILVYSQGNTLHAMTSLDRGKAWTPAPSPVSVYTPNDGTNNATFGYFCLSMAAHGGQVFLLAFAGDTQASSVELGEMRPVPPQTSPRLFVSGDAGRSWTLRAAETVGPKSAPAEYAAVPPGVFPVFPANDGTGDTESIMPPSGIGASPASGLLRLDTSYVSHDRGLTWPAA